MLFRSLQNWDYRWAGAYFITICTQNRAPYFGNIENGKMMLSAVGAIADALWYEIKNHNRDIQLGEFVVMPDHIHGILILNGTEDDALSLRGADLREDERDDNRDDQKTIGQNRFQNQGKKSVSSIIGGYKSAVTKQANRLDL